MSLAIDDYLDRVLLYANRKDGAADQIRAELHDHLTQKVADLEAEGLSTADAEFRALKDHGHAKVVGYRLRPKFPLIDVRTTGTARGWIAVGPKAVGVVAMGGVGIGVINISGMGLGVIGLGGMMGCLLFAWSGIGVAGLLSLSGIAAGTIALGAITAGVWAGGNASWAALPWADAPGWIKTLAVVFSGYSGLWIMVGLAAVLGFGIVISYAMSRREQQRVGEVGELAG
ncbi:MAG: hypothetical protein AAF750_16465 [Planctomycetota bacterium]